MLGRVASNVDSSIEWIKGKVRYTKVSKCSKIKDSDRECRNSNWFWGADQRSCDWATYCSRSGNLDNSWSWSSCSLLGASWDYKGGDCGWRGPCWDFHSFNTIDTCVVAYW